MLIQHTQPRPDLNDGQSHERKHTALHLWLALQQVRAGNPIGALWGMTWEDE